jgi:secretion/DNA translocation related TadE-like protein
MRKIQFEKVNDSGQVTILMLALVLALLSALPIVGSISQTLVNQQRLNAAADSSALAGALELEFNQPQACVVARDFTVDFPSSTLSCEVTNSKIKLVLRLPNTSSPMKYLFPILEATANAGIAQPMTDNGVD